MMSPRRYGLIVTKVYAAYIKSMLNLCKIVPGVYITLNSMKLFSKKCKGIIKCMQNYLNT
ncbi:hypothetical protein I260019D6_04930 [Dorea longicatena]